MGDQRTNWVGSANIYDIQVTGEHVLQQNEIQLNRFMRFKHNKQVGQKPRRRPCPRPINVHVTTRPKDNRRSPKHAFIVQS